MQTDDLFNIAKLTEDEIGHFEFIVNSPSYQRVFKRYMLAMKRSLQHMMLDRSEARKQTHPDDGLAYQIIFIDGFLGFLDGILANTNMERMSAAQLKTPEEQYGRLRELGLVRHSGQAVDANALQAAIDIAIAEDY